MSTIARPNTQVFLGEDIYIGMEINIFYEALQRGLQSHPEIQTVLDAPFKAVEIVYQMMEPIMTAYNIITDTNLKLKKAKRVLELAVKVYNMQVTVQTGLLATFPIAGNGAPMAFPGGAVLAPLSAALETATTALNQVEDTLDELMTALVETTTKFKSECERVQALVMDTIIEAGHFSIELEAIPVDE